jgi:hypothetical protein
VTSSAGELIRHRLVPGQVGNVGSTWLTGNGSSGSWCRVESARGRVPRVECDLAKGAVSASCNALQPTLHTLQSGVDRDRVDTGIRGGQVGVARHRRSGGSNHFYA